MVVRDVRQVTVPRDRAAPGAAEGRAAVGVGGGAGGDGEVELNHFEGLDGRVGLDGRERIGGRRAEEADFARDAVCGAVVFDVGGVAPGGDDPGAVDGGPRVVGDFRVLWVHSVQKPERLHGEHAIQVARRSEGPVLLKVGCWSNKVKSKGICYLV